jgi:hypothetical protein
MKPIIEFILINGKESYQGVKTCSAGSVLETEFYYWALQFVWNREEIEVFKGPFPRIIMKKHSGLKN